MLTSIIPQVPTTNGSPAPTFSGSQVPTTNGSPAPMYTDTQVTTSIIPPVHTHTGSSAPMYSQVRMSILPAVPTLLIHQRLYTVILKCVHRTLYVSQL